MILYVEYFVIIHNIFVSLVRCDAKEIRCYVGNYLICKQEKRILSCFQLQLMKNNPNTHAFLIIHKNLRFSKDIHDNLHTIHETLNLR